MRGNRIIRFRILADRRGLLSICRNVDRSTLGNTNEREQVRNIRLFYRDFRIGHLGGIELNVVLTMDLLILLIIIFLWVMLSRGTLGILIIIIFLLDTTL